MTNNSQFIGPDEIIRKKNEYLIPCLYHFFKKPDATGKGGDAVSI